MVLGKCFSTTRNMDGKRGRTSILRDTVICDFYFKRNLGSIKATF